VEPVESFLWINEGDPLPVFEFKYVGWIAGDEGAGPYSVLRDSDGIPYDPLSDQSAGTYVVMPAPDNDNYTYSITPAILHVNPYGPGTRAIRPVLNCIQEMEGPSGYVANFDYENRNKSAVYIPVGPDNELLGTGIDWECSDEQPTMFAPGGGSFIVCFDGTELSWSVASLDEDHKVSSAANANASSTKCPPIPKAALGTATGEAESKGTEPLQVYPNPVTGWLHLSMKGAEQIEMITLFDLSGRSYRIPVVQVRSDLMELDMNFLSPGSYMIRILWKDRVMYVPVIKN